jgi:hypothetical protein
MSGRAAAQKTGASSRTSPMDAATAVTMIPVVLPTSFS